MLRKIQGCILFDWGNTLMRDFIQFSGPMNDWPRVEAIPGAVDVLAALYPNWILAIATNAADSDETEIRAALRRADLDQFIDRIYCFKNTGQRKPEPEFFQYILNDLKISTEEVFMVGDSFKIDVLGANRLGLRAVWFNERSHDVRENGMHCTIYGLGELPDALHGFA